jgi:hypothetical protein
VESAYGEEIDGDDILDSAGRVADRILPTIVAGQANAQRLAQGFYRGFSIATLGRTIEPLQALEIAGTRADGSSVRSGMEAIGPMILGQIAGGRDLGSALEFGRYAFERFADAEVRGAADREKQNQETRPEIVGWEGIVDDAACDNCQANVGVHDLDEEMWRHGNCNCERIPVLAGS